MPPMVQPPTMATTNPFRPVSSDLITGKGDRSGDDTRQSAETASQTKTEKAKLVDVYADKLCPGLVDRRGPQCLADERVPKKPVEPQRHHNEETEHADYLGRDSSTEELDDPRAEKRFDLSRLGAPLSITTPLMTEARAMVIII